MLAIATLIGEDIYQRGTRGRRHPHRRHRVARRDAAGSHPGGLRTRSTRLRRCRPRTILRYLVDRDDGPWARLWADKLANNNNIKSAGASPGETVEALQGEVHQESARETQAFVATAGRTSNPCGTRMQPAHRRKDGTTEHRRWIEARKRNTAPSLFRQQRNTRLDLFRYFSPLTCNVPLFRLFRVTGTSARSARATASIGHGARPAMRRLICDG